MYLYNGFRVYIASPYTIGDVAVNVRRQMNAADELMNLGFAPFTPLYSHFQHMHKPRKYEDWVAYDLVWIELCDIVLRLRGDSIGADKEVAHAESLDIPIAYSITDVIRLTTNTIVKRSSDA